MKKLFFGGLDPRVTERTLWEIAQFAGPVESVRLPPSSLVFGGGGGGAGGGGAGGGGGAAGGNNNNNDGGGGGDEAAATAAEGGGGGGAEEETGTRKATPPPPPPPPPHAGFGFVVFEDRAAALYCLEMLRDSLYLFGRKVRVELSSSSG